MFQLQQRSATAFDPILVRDSITLRSPRLRDYGDWVALRKASRAHLTRWENVWSDNDLSLAAFRRRLRVWERQRRKASGLCLFIRRMDDDQLIGGVTLSNIRFGAARTGVVGYWIGAPFVRQGYGRLAVDEAVIHGFESIGLNRIEAACQPENHASGKLLQSLGFQLEGRARGYLRINGEWRDHDIYALIESDWADETSD